MGNRYVTDKKICYTIYNYIHGQIAYIYIIHKICTLAMYVCYIIIYTHKS